MCLHGTAFLLSICHLAELLHRGEQGVAFPGWQAAAASLSRRVGTPRKQTCRSRLSVLFVQALSLVHVGRSNELLSLGFGDREIGRAAGEETETFLLLLENR